VIVMLPPNIVCAQAAPTRRSSLVCKLQVPDFDAGGKTGPHERLPDRRSLRRGKALGTGLLATLLAALLVTGCGYKTPLELPKRAPPAKSAS